MKTFRFVPFLLIIVTAAVGQARIPLQFVDISGKGSPMRLYSHGEWSNSPSTISYSVSGKNISDKTIIAYVISVGTFCTMRHDFFFKPVGIDPGDTDELVNESDFPFGKVSSATPPLKLVLRFVQFEDGSTWGETEAGAPLIALRTETRDFLAASLDAYNRGGEKELLSLLTSKKPESVMSAVALHALEIQKQSGTEAAVNHLQTRLKAGMARWESGRF